MRKIYIFDIDGTLTPSRLQMTEKFLEFFNGWSKQNPFYLVTGSDLNKTKEQVPDFILERTEAVFTCCGNQMWRDGELVYDNKFIPPKSLIKYLEERLENSKYPKRCGNHIENRGSLLNFSIVGRDCSYEDRIDYFEYDNENRERKNIVKGINFGWSDLDAVIGGQISIDIYPKGNDKSQVLEHIEKRHETGEIIFIGDRIEGGGNDYPLAQLMDNIEDCDWYQTEGWEQTKKILEELDD
jgi:phosphomannomutase